MNRREFLRKSAMLASFWAGVAILPSKTSKKITNLFFGTRKSETIPLGFQPKVTILTCPVSNSSKINAGDLVVCDNMGRVRRAEPNEAYVGMAISEAEYDFETESYRVPVFIHNEDCPV